MIFLSQIYNSHYKVLYIFFMNMQKLGSISAVISKLKDDDNTDIHQNATV
jgi:hypothetical protein